MKHNVEANDALILLPLYLILVGFVICLTITVLLSYFEGVEFSSLPDAAQEILVYCPVLIVLFVASIVLVHRRRRAGDMLASLMWVCIGITCLASAIEAEWSHNLGSQYLSALGITFLGIITWCRHPSKQ